MTSGRQGGRAGDAAASHGLAAKDRSSAEQRTTKSRSARAGPAQPEPLPHPLWLPPIWQPSKWGRNVYRLQALARKPETPLLPEASGGQVGRIQGGRML